MIKHNQIYYDQFFADYEPWDMYDENYHFSSHLILDLEIRDNLLEELENA